MESIKLSKSFKVKPKVIYSAWLNSKEHSKMTGSKAKVNQKVNSAFSAWDGYITGKTTELESNRKIVQHWRTTEFPEDAPDSILEIQLEETPTGTKLKMNHKNIPEGQGENYKKGWMDFYFKPMEDYFKR
ncbi:MAG TPA: SRPBCC domain-containing protein [Ignavibacteriaceae bacterium]